MDVKSNVLAAVAPSLSVARCAPTVIVGAPGIMWPGGDKIGASWQLKDVGPASRDRPRQKTAPFLRLLL